MINVLRLLVLGLIAGVGAAWAFDPPHDNAGKLSARLESPGEALNIDHPIPVRLVLTNSGDASTTGTVELRVIDDWMVSPSGNIPFSVGGGATTTFDFEVKPGPSTCNGHYPIHAFVAFEHEGEKVQAHPVQLVECRVPVSAGSQPPVEWRPYDTRQGTELPLWRLPVFRMVLLPETQDPGRTLAPGWQGGEEETGASLGMGGDIDRNGVRAAIAMHPPWKGDRFRSVLAEFPVALPTVKPIVLSFGNAIRDHVPERGEPASDGVTFRVRVLPSDASDGAAGDVVFERFTDAKAWQDGEADLSAYAGQAVRIQLESHPGPHNNTACDQSYWAEPTLMIGSPYTAASQPAGPARVLGTIVHGDARYTVEVTPGPRGLLDATVAFAPEGGSGRLSFTGFPLRVLGDDLSETRSLAKLVSVSEEGDQGPGHYHMRHRFESPAGSYDVLVELWASREAFQARFRLENTPAPKPWRAVYIEDVAAGPWNRMAQRVYAGVGNVIEYPKTFQMYFDGHQLSTSFVGFEFDDIALVQAVDVPPSMLNVNPDKRHYSIHAAHSATLTFIPTRTVWEGARAWHDINGLAPAPSVDKLAGRFVFDLWGGRYADSAQALEKAFRYGLIDSAVMWHAWQRWGYDYRLPDIYPPTPHQGTLEEFQILAETCRRNGVLFAPHDNYIDFYPDAEGFSYDKICFWQEGQPVRGWLNEGREAQAYRWRIDAVQPFLQRNLRLIKDNIAPTAYFIDVWSSIQPYDYWTRDGHFYDRVYTRNEIGQYFNWIRTCLGNNAPQVSESGHDQLIGSLDGAQTNHLRVWRPGDPTPPSMVWNVACDDAERVPWLDAAHHDRFVLHGAGYESRYAGGLDPRDHGIYSDDYICTEVLTGHPAMVPEPFGRNVVRKYWLLHDLMRAVALDRIEAVEYGGNIHRQHVSWEGADVWVNRGADDWTVEGHVLPPYGFYARGPREHVEYEAAIERRGDAVVEWAASPASVFANARPLYNAGTTVSAPEPPVRFLGDGRFDLTLNWNAERPLAGNRRVFVHFVDTANKVRFQADYDPAQPTTGWQGSRTDTVPVVLPADAHPGDAFEVRAGLYEPGTHAREQLDGWDDGARGIRLGTVRLEGQGDTVTAVSWTPLRSDARAQLRNPAGTEAVARALTTDGACRLTIEGDTLRLTPLPESRPFKAVIRWNDLPWNLPEPTRVECLDEHGRSLDQQPLALTNGAVELTCTPDVFAYRISGGNP